MLLAWSSCKPLDAAYSLMLLGAWKFLSLLSPCQGSTKPTTRRTPWNHSSVARTDPRLQIKRSLAVKSRRLSLVTIFPSLGSRTVFGETPPALLCFLPLVICGTLSFNHWKRLSTDLLSSVDLLFLSRHSLHTVICTDFSTSFRP
jgi:hypothetical protein